MSTDDIRTTALGKIRGYTQYERGKSRLSELDALTRDVQPADEQLRGAVDAYLNGNDDIDIADVAVEAERAKTYTAAMYELGNIVRELQSHYPRLRRFRAEEVEPALRYLDEELTNLISEVRFVDESLYRIASLEDAVKHGKQDTWLRLVDMTERYEQIRAAQRAVTTQHHLLEIPGVPIPIDAYFACAYLADALDREDYWVTQRTAAAMQSSNSSDPSERDYLEWLRPAPDAAGGFTKNDKDDRIWPDQSHEMYLRWIATNAQPWVPTVDQLTSAFIAADGAIKSIGRNGLSPVLGLHISDYYEITETTSARPIPALAVEPTASGRASSSKARRVVSERIRGK
jgi:hypothetical protein